MHVCSIYMLARSVRWVIQGACVVALGLICRCAADTVARLELSAALQWRRVVVGAVAPRDHYENWVFGCDWVSNARLGSLF